MAQAPPAYVGVEVDVPELGEVEGILVFGSETDDSPTGITLLAGSDETREEASYLRFHVVIADEHKDDAH